MLDKLRMLFVIAACFALVLVPVLGRAQGGVLKGAKEGVQKGTTEVQKGVEQGVEKTKEGAEAVGQETKKAITGQENQPSENRMKPSQPGSEERSTEESSKENKGGETGQKGLPKTAGELPLLALAGCLALAGAGTLKVVRQRS